MLCLMSRSSVCTSISARHSTFLALFTCVLFWLNGETNISKPFAQRYLLIKGMKPEERKKVVKKVVFFAGKAAPACMSFQISTLGTLVDLWSPLDYIAKLVSSHLPFLERKIGIAIFRPSGSS